MAAFSFSGLASGLDTGSIVSALVNVERAPIRRIESEQKTLGSRQDKFEKMRDLLNELKSVSEDLNSKDVILSAAGASSEEDAFTVEVAGSVPSGIYDINIVNEATSERTYSAGTFPDKYQGGNLFGTNGGTGTLSITVGSDAQVDIPVDDNSTLDSLVKAINNSNADVTAGIVFDGSAYRLMVNGNRTGSNGQITFGETGTTVGLQGGTEYRSAQPASFTLDGNAYTSDTNTVTDAIPGVTLNLLGATTGTQKITFTADNSALTDKLDKFVAKFNSLYTKLNTELTSRADSGTSSTSSTLNGDSTLRTVQQRLSRAITTPASGPTGSFSTLADLGISVDRTGTMALDKDKLASAIAKDPDSVAKVIMEDTANGSKGVIANMATMLDGLTNTTDGLITNRIDGIDDRKRDLDDQIARMELHIDSYESQLSKKFTAMETAMANLQAQGSQLSAILGSL